MFFGPEVLSRYTAVAVDTAPQVGRYSWQHQLQGVLEFEKVDFANRSIVAFGSVTDHEWNEHEHSILHTYNIYI